MQWSELTDLNQLEQISRESSERKVLIFKHSTRCSVSRAVLDRLERSWSSEEMEMVKPYFLDLINHRQISNAIEEKFGIEHESPQLIIVEKKRLFMRNRILISTTLTLKKLSKVKLNSLLNSIVQA